MELFKFTDNQRSELLTAWKTAAGKAKAEEYLDRIELPIDSYLNLWLKSSMSQVDFLEMKRDIKKQANSLLGHLLSLNGREEWALNVSFEMTAKAWNEPPPIGKSFLDSLVRQLQIVEAVCDQQINNGAPLRRGPNKSLEYMLLVPLISIYKKVFEKNPSASANGIFMTFLGELNNVIGERIGPDLVKRALADYP